MDLSSLEIRFKEDKEANNYDVEAEEMPNMTTILVVSVSSIAFLLSGFVVGVAVCWRNRNSSTEPADVPEVNYEISMHFL